jgi:predicted enzyme related to lactoylglutathione lyase
MDRKPHPYLRGELVIVIDCHDLNRSAQFWASVLGYARNPSASGHYQNLVPASGEGVEVLLQQVPDQKRGKNHVHLDLRTQDLEPEVARILGLGAILVTSEPITEDGWRWHIMADPDGNEFCVLQPPGTGNARA